MIVHLFETLLSALDDEMRPGYIEREVALSAVLDTLGVESMPILARVASGRSIDEELLERIPDAYREAVDLRAIEVADYTRRLRDYKRELNDLMAISSALSLAQEFRIRSPLCQGYMEIEMHRSGGGIGGAISFRYDPSGARDGQLYFRSADDLLRLVHNLLENQAERNAKLEKEI